MYTTGRFLLPAQGGQSGDPSHASDRQLCKSRWFHRTLLFRVHVGW